MTLSTCNFLQVAILITQVNFATSTNFITSHLCTDVNTEPCGIQVVTPINKTNSPSPSIASYSS